MREMPKKKPTLTSDALRLMFLLALLPKKKENNPISSRRTENPKQTTITLEIVLFSTFILLSLRSASTKKQALSKNPINKTMVSHFKHLEVAAGGFVNKNTTWRVGDTQRRDKSVIPPNSSQFISLFRSVMSFSKTASSILTAMLQYLIEKTQYTTTAETDRK